MSVRRVVTLLSACLAASASTAVAQPKKPAPAKAPVAPAKDAPAPAPAPAAEPAPAAGTPVQMTEEPPPSDIEGRDENPDAPRTGDEPKVVVSAPVKMKRSGYPIREAARPITLPQNLSEVGIAPHAQLSPYRGADALRARYGITNQIQLGLTYVTVGIFDDPFTQEDKIGAHLGKAVGIDVTVMLKDWIGVRLGVPVYVDPAAVSIVLGAPLKWQFADGKFAIGGMDEFLTIKVKRFAPSFYQEQANALAAAGTDPMSGNQTVQSKGALRFSGFGVMQYREKVAFLGRLGVTVDDFSTTKTAAGGGLSTFIRAGVQWTPRKWVDLGFSLGFDDLATAGSFGPAGLLVFRI